MSHCDAGPTEDGGQRRRVDRQRVHERHLVGPGDLDQRQVGHVGALGMELGVEAVRVLRRRFGDQLLEPRPVDHDGRRCSHLDLPVPDLVSGTVVLTVGAGGSTAPASVRLDGAEPGGPAGSGPRRLNLPTGVVATSR